MRRKSFREGFSAFDLLQYILNHGPKSGFGGKFGRYAQASIQRQAGFHQRGQFLREEEDVFLGNTLKVVTSPRRFGSRCLNGDGYEAHALYPLGDGTVVGSFEAALSEPA